MSDSRMLRQLKFVLELDKLKQVMRRNYVCGGSRRENSAEHSWETALTVLLLAEHSDVPIDPLRAAKMMLVHDIVEIDAGDTFIYDAQGRTEQQLRETRAADRIFSMLPEDQAREFRDLWDEFEAESTPESRFAKAVDRLMPMLHNYDTRGKSWREHDLDRGRVLQVNSKIGDASTTLWDYAKSVIEKASEEGLLRKD
jgi:putative hydrolases of HD superfamily